MCHGYVLDTKRTDAQPLVFGGIDLQDSEKMNNLVPFLTSNPSLRGIILDMCNIGPAGINILSNTLLDCSEVTLEVLDLCHNQFSEIDLDKVVIRSDHRVCDIPTRPGGSIDEFRLHPPISFAIPSE